VDQARISLLTAQNQYRASWKQLAAALGLRDMPPTELEGRVDMPVPSFEYQTVHERVLRSHTDVRTAYNAISQARFNLALAKVTNVPDVDLNILPQKDYTSPPNFVVYSVQFAVPVPVWNQNKGAIKQAEGLLAQAQAQPDIARNNLTNTLADAFNRYQTSHQVAQITMRQVRDQLVAFRGIYARRQQLPAEGVLPPQAIGVAFSDVVTAQQTLATYIQAYVTALGQQWQAVVDVANVLQTDDLFQVGATEEMLPVPELQQLAPNGEGMKPRKNQ
jgi:cobalt-zinc-cadmium efflux system outer membrane protein